MELLVILWEVFKLVLLFISLAVFPIAVLFSVWYIAKSIFRAAFPKPERPKRVSQNVSVNAPSDSCNTYYDYASEYDERKKREREEDERWRRRLDDDIYTIHAIETEWGDY